MGGDVDCGCESSAAISRNSAADVDRLRLRGCCVRDTRGLPSTAASVGESETRSGSVAYKRSLGPGLDAALQHATRARPATMRSFDKFWRAVWAHRVEAL